MRLLALTFCCLGLLPAYAADLSAVRHVPHFAEVNGHLYRGGQPTVLGMEELGAFGIKRVIDLRGKGEAGTNEASTFAKLGIKYVNVPFPAFSAPTQEDVGSVLAMLLDKDNTPTFIHCLRGKDRTGTVIACYRIQHDGWKNAAALDEAKSHGLSSFERGMRSFVLHFTAVPGTSPLVAGSR